MHRHQKQNTKSNTLWMNNVNKDLGEISRQAGSSRNTYSFGESSKVKRSINSQQEYEGKIRGLEKMIQQLSSSNDGYRKEIKVLEEKLDKSDKLSIHLEQAKNMLMGSSKYQSEKIPKIYKKLAESEKRMIEKIGELDQLNQVSSFRYEMQREKSEKLQIELLKTKGRKLEVDSYITQIKELKLEIVNTQSSMEQLKLELEGRVSESGSLKLERDSFKDKIKYLDEEKEQARQEADFNIQQRNKLEEDFNSLLEENKLLKSEIQSSNKVEVDPEIIKKADLFDSLMQGNKSRRFKKKIKEIIGKDVDYYKKYIGIPYEKCLEDLKLLELKNKELEKDAKKGIKQSKVIDSKYSKELAELTSEIDRLMALQEESKNNEILRKEDVEDARMEEDAKEGQESLNKNDKVEIEEQEWKKEEEKFEQKPKKNKGSRKASKKGGNKKNKKGKNGKKMNSKNNQKSLKEEMRENITEKLDSHEDKKHKSLEEGIVPHNHADSGQKSPRGNHRIQSMKDRGMSQLEYSDEIVTRSMINKAKNRKSQTPNKRIKGPILDQIYEEEPRLNTSEEVYITNTTLKNKIKICEDCGMRLRINTKGVSCQECLTNWHSDCAPEFVKGQEAYICPTCKDQLNIIAKIDFKKRKMEEEDLGRGQQYIKGQQVESRRFKLGRVDFGEINKIE